MTAILVLCGLPADLTASILAHEAMHAWCSLRKEMPFYLPARVEEGLCQLIAYKYIEYLREGRGIGSGAGAGDKFSKLEWNSKLRAFIINQITSDPCPVYGDGFRQAAKCCSELPLDVLLDYVKVEKDFPHMD